jgi:hypothetical protein
MARAGIAGVSHHVEGSGFGFSTLLVLDVAALTLPHQCRMSRPS